MGAMRHWFKAWELPVQRGLLSGLRPVVAPATWQGWTLTVLWIAAMAVTLGAAATQSLQTFLYAVLATGGGTAAALWMLRGRVKPAR
jgi:hypothetical protein